MKEEFTFQSKGSGANAVRNAIKGAVGKFRQFDPATIYEDLTNTAYIFTIRSANRSESITVNCALFTGTITFTYNGSKVPESFRASTLKDELQAYGVPAQEIETQPPNAQVVEAQRGVASTHHEDASDIAEVKVRIVPDPIPSDTYIDLDRVLRDFFPDFEEGGMKLTDTGFECTNPDKARVAKDISVTYLSATGELSIKGPRSVFENRAFDKETLSDALDNEGFVIAVESQTTAAPVRPWKSAPASDSEGSSSRRDARVEEPRPAVAQAQLPSQAQPVLRTPQDPQVGKTQNLAINLGKAPTEADVQLIAKRFFEQMFTLRQDADGSYPFVSYNFEGRIRLDAANRRILIEFHARVPGVYCPTTGEIEKELRYASKTHSITMQIGKGHIDPARADTLAKRFFPNLERTAQVQIEDEAKGPVVIVKFRTKGSTEDPILKVIFYMRTGEVVIVGPQEYLAQFNQNLWNPETQAVVLVRHVAEGQLFVAQPSQQKQTSSGPRRERWQIEMGGQPSVTIQLPDPATREDLIAFGKRFVSSFSREEISTEPIGFRGAGERVSCLWTKGLARVMAVTDIATPLQIMQERLPVHAKEIVIHSNDPSVLDKIRSEGEKFAASRARPGQQEGLGTSFKPPQAQPPANLGGYRKQFTGGSGGIV